MSGRISQMAQAIQGWDQVLREAGERPRGLFGQKIIIEAPGVYIDAGALDCEFDVPFDDDTQANEAKITVYNLSGNTRSRFTYNTPITVTAGYGEDTGLIFAGRVLSCRGSYSGMEHVTTITALDSMDLQERKIDSIAFQKGVRASYILRDLTERLGLPVAVFRPKRDHVYTKGANVSGDLMRAVEQYARVCGVSAYICKGRVFVQDVRDGEDIGFTVSAETGLVGSPEYFEEQVSTEDFTDTVTGYKIQMLLQHRMTTAAEVRLASRGIGGVFHVRCGSHRYDGNNLLTECEVIA